MKVPGICAGAVVISTACRENRGEDGAIDAALTRIRARLVATMERWPREKGATFFIAVSVDSQGRIGIGEE